MAAYLLAAGQAGEDGVRGAAFNVSDGRPWTVLEVAELIDELTGVHEPPRAVLGTAEAEGEIPRQTLDADRFRRALGWEPTVALREGLTRTIAWYRAHLGA